LTADIAIVLAVLLVSLVLFISERIRMDVVSLMVLGTLALTGLVTPDQAFSGFSNPAVITVWAMFILSDGLTRTGIARIVGEYVTRFAGGGEKRLVVVIMLTAGVLSAFMNNIGVAALMLPVVIDVARVTGYPPSRLLMPLAYSTLLGGLTTLIGTPPNLLISGSLANLGFQSFGLFDFTPLGGAVLVFGTLFVVIVGLKVLPSRDPGREVGRRSAESLEAQYGLKERTVVLALKPRSVLVGKTLRESRIGASTGLIVTGLIHDGDVNLLPGPDSMLREGQRLLVQGKLDHLRDLTRFNELIIERETSVLNRLVSDKILLFEVKIAENSGLLESRLDNAEFRRRYRANVLAIRTEPLIRRLNLTEVELHAGDRLLVQGGEDAITLMEQSGDFEDCYRVSNEDLEQVYRLEDRVFVVRVPSNSSLVGETLAGSRIGDAFDFRLLGTIREGRLNLMPDPQQQLVAEERLLIQGEFEQVEVLQGLQDLVVEKQPAPYQQVLQSQRMDMIEAMLAPRSGLAGRRIKDVKFRERYGLEVLAIWRQGRAYRSDLAAMELQFGDALLLLGPRDKMDLLRQDADFLILTRAAEALPDTRKAPLAAGIMLAVVGTVLAGLLPIAVAAVIGATLMVLSRCLTMEEAYRAIEWRAIFLIAGMLPLGIAMESTGAAQLLASGMVELLGEYGPWPMLAGFYLVTAAATMIIPTAALVVLMAPIVVSAFQDLGLLPYPAMMAVAMAASASFTSPISHPANLLVMGPGGYRFNDYLRLGVPLTIVVFVVVMLLLPVLWPWQRA
jgi:di/tricarboxylate transporter